MLHTKIEFTGVDKTGRVISIKDATGLYSSPDNEGGYGGTNPGIADIESILFTISELESSKVYKLRFVLTPDPDHPEYLVQPSISDIANGNAEVEFTSIVLGITDPQDGLKAFSDGIYDINMYTLVELTAGTGTEGDKVITGSNLDDVYAEVGYIVVDNDIYTIDKLVDSDPDSITLKEELKQDVTEFYLAYRANTKALNQAASDCCGTQEAGKVAEKEGCGCADKKLDNLFKLWMYKIAAQIDYNCGNYIQAHELLKGAQKVCKSFKCKC